MPDAYAAGRWILLPRYCEHRPRRRRGDDRRSDVRDDTPRAGGEVGCAEQRERSWLSSHFAGRGRAGQSEADLPPAEEDPQASVPMDLTSVQGYILNGRVHAHITLSDENSMVGGHLEPGTIALTFFIFTVGVLPDDLVLGDLDTPYYNKPSE